MIEKIQNVPFPVWLVLAAIMLVFAVFVRATNKSNAKPDIRVSKPVQPLANGTPYNSRPERRWRHPQKEQAERILSDPNDPTHKN